MAQLTEKQAPWTPLLLEFKRQKTRVAHAVYMEQHIRNILAYRATETLQEVAQIKNSEAMGRLNRSMFGPFSHYWRERRCETEVPTRLIAGLKQQL